MYYVYLLIDPRSELPFYVGKGRDGRMLEHEKEAVKGSRSLKHDRIREIRAAEHAVRYEIDSWHDRESDAYRRERELINAHPGLLNVAVNARGNEPPKIDFLQCIWALLDKTTRYAKARQAVRILTVFPYEAMPTENHQKLWRMTWHIGWNALNGR